MATATAIKVEPLADESLPGSAPNIILCSECATSGHPTSDPPEQYKNIHDLEVHVRTDHVLLLPYGCPYCRYVRLPTELSLKQHLMTIHSDKTDPTVISFIVKEDLEEKVKNILRASMPDVKPAMLVVGRNSFEEEVTSGFPLQHDGEEELVLRNLPPETPVPPPPTVTEELPIDEDNDELMPNDEVTAPPPIKKGRRKKTVTEELPIDKDDDALMPQDEVTAPPTKNGRRKKSADVSKTPAARKRRKSRLSKGHVAPVDANAETAPFGNVADGGVQQDEQTVNNGAQVEGVCSLCGDGESLSRELWERHIVENHLAGDVFQCSVCVTSYATKDKVNAHIIADHNQPHYVHSENPPHGRQRRQDATLLRTLNSLLLKCFGLKLKGEKAVLPKKTDLSSPFLEEPYRNETAVAEEVRQESPPPQPTSDVINCAECGARGIKRKDMSNHVFVHHVKKPLVTCSGCSQMFNSWQPAKKHVQKEHPDGDASAVSMRGEYAEDAKALYQVCFPGEHYRPRGTLKTPTGSRRSVKTE